MSCRAVSEGGGSSAYGPPAPDDAIPTVHFSAMLPAAAPTRRVEAVVPEVIDPKVYGASLAIIGRAVTVLNLNGKMREWTQEQKLKFLSKIPEWCPYCEQLDLRCNELDDEAATMLAKDVLYRLHNLKHLDLRSNKIGKNGGQELAGGLIAGGIVFAPALKYLNLSHNQISSDEGAEAFSDTRGCIVVLEEIELESNSLGCEGISTGEAAPRQPRRRRFPVEKIESPRDLVMRLIDEGATLVHLNLNGRLRGWTQAEICDFLSCIPCVCPKLQTLDLGCNGLDDAAAIVLATEVLPQLSSCLKMLDLRSNRIGSSGGKSLAEGIESIKCLTYLDLSGNVISFDAIEKLCTSLAKTQPDLEYLNFAYNPLGREGIDALADAVPRFPKLMYLILAGTHMNSNRHYESGFHDCIPGVCLVFNGMQRIAEALANHPNLRLLDVSDNMLGLEGAKSLARVLQSCRQLRYLNLARTQLGVAEITIIADALTYLRKLEYLNLNGNPIGSKGIRILSDSFPHLKLLKKLFISGCKIGGGEDPSIVNNFMYLEKLEILDLSVNKLKALDLTGLCLVLPCLGRLVQLDLATNALRNEGMKLLAKKVQKQSVLSHLNLGGNSIGSRGVRAFLETLGSSKSLQGLYLDGVGMDDDGAAALSNRLRRNLFPQLIVLSIGENEKLTEDGVLLVTLGFKGSDGVERQLGVQGIKIKEQTLERFRQLAPNVRLAK